MDTNVLVEDTVIIWEGCAAISTQTNTAIAETDIDHVLLLAGPPGLGVSTHVVCQGWVNTMLRGSTARPSATVTLCKGYLHGLANGLLDFHPQTIRMREYGYHTIFHLALASL